MLVELEHVKDPLPAQVFPESKTGRAQGLKSADLGSIPSHGGRGGLLGESYDPESQFSHLNNGLLSIRVTELVYGAGM